MEFQSKTIEINQELSSNISQITLTGKLSGQDYEELVPAIEQLIAKHGKLRILLELHDFHGWDAGALWEDTKFAFKNFNDIERIAIVGDKKWEQGMVYFCKPFTTAKVRYFDVSELEEARNWVSES